MTKHYCDGCIKDITNESKGFGYREIEHYGISAGVFCSECADKLDAMLFSLINEKWQEYKQIDDRFNKAVKNMIYDVCRKNNGEGG